MSGSTSQELRAREERAGPKATIITPRGPAPAPAPGETPTVVEPAEVEPGEDPKVSEGPRPSIVQGTLLAGRYRIERHLGSGGMGDVFLAEHVDLRRSVAIKILGAEYTRRPELVRRFLTEARAASMIRHDHVVDITDFGYTAERVPFFVMEWLDGEDLSATIRREAPIHWQRARAIIIQLLVALEAAHEHGVIHRDIKPGNCFRVNLRGNPDYIKVLDFGIAKVRSGAESDPGVKTGTGVVMGTTDYMSPEQAQGLPLDHRTDLYSVGIILFQLITNRLPFTADTLLAALVKRLAEEPPSPRAKAPSADISPELERVVLKSLARSRDDRYANARAFIEALEGIGALPTPAIKPRSSRGLVATAGGLIAALIGVWTWYNMVGVAADPDRATSATSATSAAQGTVAADTAPANQPDLRDSLDDAAAGVGEALAAGAEATASDDAALATETDALATEAGALEREVASDELASETDVASSDVEPTDPFAAMTTSDALEQTSGPAATDATSEPEAPASTGEATGATGEATGEPGEKAPLPEQPPERAIESVLRRAAVKAERRCRDRGAITGLAIRVNLVFNPAGKVIDVKVQAPYGDSPIGVCLSEVVRAARFPKSKLGGAAEHKFRF